MTKVTKAMQRLASFSLLLSNAIVPVPGVPMQWTILNALGGLAWLAGLTFAKGMTLPLGDNLIGSDQHLFLGVLCSLVGLAVLLWANFRSPA